MAAGSINLTPNLFIVATQMVIFLFNLVLVKVLFLNPFLAIRKKREEITEGNQGLALKLQAETQTQLDQISERIKNIKEENEETTVKLRLKTASDIESMLETAKSESKKAIQSSRELLAQHALEARTQVPQQIKALTKEFEMKILSIN